ncbi:MAG: tRNA lysidine(34) synthetase TilS [Pseudolabrys sp.]|nr:tRNA lysidine(34) synthetase TilS [Pseudolabrys sp.]
MRNADPDLGVTAAEAGALFADLKDAKALVLAVSGGPDSTALMWLTARWAKSSKRAPVLTAITVDHGLRKESKREALDVARLAKKLGIAHRTLRWTGTKPKTGLPQAARHARYRLLAAAARKAGAEHVLTGHTLDDQAETVLIRLLRGSGLTGLAAMQRSSPLPDGEGISLVRPFLDISKVRLIATLNAEKIPFADDPTNRDPKFTRARLRGLMPKLAEEGLDAPRLALLARRLARAEAALVAATGAAEDHMVLDASPTAVAYDRQKFGFLPDEITLRALNRAITAIGSEGPVELSKLEALKSALDSAQNSGTAFRRTLAGAIVTLSRDRITVERAPARQNAAGGPRRKALTKARPGHAKGPKTR